MRIGVVGLNHKLAKLDMRERFAKVCSRRFSVDSSVHGYRFFVLLSTCNRTEIYFYSDDLAETHSYLLGILRRELEEDFEQKLYSFFGVDCFLHLSKVTAGLDSAIIAETEIQGQVKNAYMLASTYVKLPYELHYLFQKALHVGKQARHSLPASQSLPSIEEAVFNSGKALFKDLVEANILFIGASQINRKILIFLKSKQCCNITICNRTFDEGKNVSQTHRVNLMSWNKLNEWQNYDWIIVGTKAQNYLLSDHNLASDKTKLIIDLSIPRNVNPVLGDFPGICLKNLDELHRMIINQKHQFQQAVNEAEKVVFDSSKKQVALFRERRTVLLDQLVT